MPANKEGSGRRDVLEEARSILELIAALHKAGDTLSVDSIVSRLGIDRGAAEKMMELILSLGSESGSFLPLYYADATEDTVKLADDAGVRGRPLRLTERETLALSAAFDALGIGRDVPLRKRAEKAFATSGVTEAEVRRIFSQPLDERDAQTLSRCARAIVSDAPLTLSYQGEMDDAPRARHVLPERVRTKDGLWYLEALDQACMQERTFRVDRILDARIGRLAKPRATKVAASSRPDLVRLTFRDPYYLVLFEWPGLTITDGTDGTVSATIPYYKTSSWLPRTLAACGGMVTSDDEELNLSVAQYAEDLLEQGPPRASNKLEDY